MKKTIKTLALLTTGLVVGVVVERVNNKRYRVESLDEILIIEMTKRRPKGIVLDLNGNIKDKFYMTEVE